MTTPEKLLSWYFKNKRDLPWRKNTDPYRILVSEIMLQQTRVEAVIYKYTQFMEQFPNLQVLALAKLEDVLKAWEGLGYYRRAKYLKMACEVIYFEFRGRFPSDSHSLKKLPGIGEYTSAAIASISFNESIPVIDGNVMRIICRIYGLRGNPYASSTKKMIKNCFDEGFFSISNPGDFNQAMMELGAMVCTPKSPLCFQCPLLRQCKAHNENLIGELPELKQKQKLIKKHLYFLVWPDSITGMRLTDHTWMNYQKGYKSLPWIESGEVLSVLEIKQQFENKLSIHMKHEFQIKSFKHSITKYKLDCSLIIPIGNESLTLKEEVLESGLMKKAVQLLCESSL